jgi:hypothetical protein
MAFLASLFLVSIIIYIFTLNPALFRNDSPETITACITLGVSHPPGYPLHTLIGRLFSFSSVGNPAFTLNLFSAFLAAIGVCLLAANIWMLCQPSIQTPSRRIGNDIFTLSACAIGAIALAFSKNYWSCALSAKGSIYILQIVVELTLILHLQRWVRHQLNSHKTQPNHQLYFFLFLFSLGLINHWPTQVLLIPALILLALLLARDRRLNKNKLVKFKTILMSAAFASVVLSTYLYLPLRSHLYPALNFGAPYTFSRFIDSVFRTGYFKIETYASAVETALPNIWQKAAYIFAHLVNESHFSFFIAALFGIWFLYKEGRKTYLSASLLVVLTAVFINLVYLQVQPIEFWHMDDHLLTVDWVMALLGAYGIFGFLNAIGKTSFFSRSNFRKVLALVLLLCAIPALAFFKNLPANNQTREFLYYGYGQAALKSTDENAGFFAESDYDYFSLLYLKEVEMKRPDVYLFLTSFLMKDYEYEIIPRRYFDLKAIDMSPIYHTFPPEMRAIEFFRYIKSGPMNRPMYCAFANGPVADIFLHNGFSFKFRPYGFLVRVFPKEKLVCEHDFLKPLDDFWIKYLEPKKRTSNPINGLLLELCSHPFLNAANYMRLQGDMSRWDDLYEKALSLIQDKRWLGEEWAKRADGDLASGNKPLTLGAYEMSALEYLSAGLPEKGVESLKKAIALDPENLNLRRILKNLEPVK